jgi:hypothetical protein
MTQPEYPEQWKRERMLWFVHEWLQENLTDEDPVPQLDYYKVRDWGNEQEGLNGAQAMYLFKQLVEEDYIAVSSMNTQISELPWDVAWPQALTTKGLLQIGELPDSSARLLRSLTAIEEAIARLNVDDQQKTTAMKAADELKGFLRQLPREAAGEVAAAAVTEIGRGFAQGSGVG